MSLARGFSKRIALIGLLMICFSFSVSACGMSGVAKAEETASAKGSQEDSAMTISIGEKTLPVSWEENVSVEALRELCPLTIQMSMYGGFEQVGPIGTSLPWDDTV